MTATVNGTLGRRSLKQIDTHTWAASSWVIRNNVSGGECSLVVRVFGRRMVRHSRVGGKGTISELPLPLPLSIFHMSALTL